MEEKKMSLPHRMTLDNRQAGIVTGVQDVHSFHEEEIMFMTDAGKLQIKGEQLHVKRLDLEKGEADIEGKVNSLTYLSKTVEKREESFLKRMFR